MAAEAVGKGEDHLLDAVIGQVRQFSPGQRRRLASYAAEGLNRSDQQALHRELDRAFLAPRRSTADFLWVVVVLAFAIVLVGSFATIAASIFVGVRDMATVQTVLSLFMAVVGFLGGLFTPAPSAARSGQITTQTTAPADADVQTDVHGRSTPESTAAPAPAVQ